MKLLLLSNSTVYGRAPLEHVHMELQGLVGPASTVVVFPYGRRDHAAQFDAARPAFARLGARVINAGTHPSPRQAVCDATVFYVAGGNTFRLLKSLYDLDILDSIRRRTLDGVPYLASSAGSTVACPSIMTCNSMPIVEPPSFRAMGLIPFQINNHYVAGPPIPTHMGETREQRIREYHDERPDPVLALREGSWIRQDADRITLHGERGACLFRRAQEPAELSDGYDLADVHTTF